MVDQLNLVIFDCPCCGTSTVCLGERPLLNCEECGELVPVPMPLSTDDDPTILN